MSKNPYKDSDKRNVSPAPSNYSDKFKDIQLNKELNEREPGEINSSSFINKHSSGLYYRD